MTNFEKEYYEAPEFWGEKALSDKSNLARIAQTAELIPEDVSSLGDIGCGNGLFAHYLLEHKPTIRVTAIDRSEQALSHVKTQKALGEVTAIPAADRQFEIVTCLQVLEHIPVSYYESALKELARVSAKYLLISVPYQEDLLVNATCCPGCQTRFNADLHLRSYDDNAIQQLFSGEGFRHVQSVNMIKSQVPYGIEYYHRARSMMKRSMPTFDAPICPVCGFHNTTFKKHAVATVHQRKNWLKAVAFSFARSVRRGVSRILKPFWPLKAVPGYWIIALYERTND